MNDVVVIVKRDTAALPADTLDILLILTDAKIEAAVYTSLEAAEAGLGKESAAYPEYQGCGICRYHNAGISYCCNQRVSEIG